VEICDFVYHQPRTLLEACRLGYTHDRNARFLAGGTELLPDLKQHRDTTQHLVDLKSIGDLRKIRMDGRHLRIGSLVTLSEVAESPQVLLHVPALAEAILTMAALQIRNRGTLGGNFCSGVPSADTPPICMAACAETVIATAEGTRTVPAEEFFLGPRRIALARGEILAEIVFPAPAPHSGANYQRFALRRATALAVAGVAAMLELDGSTIREARVVLGAVAPIPMLAVSCNRLLAGQEPVDKTFARAAEAAAAEAQPISDLRGSAAFRRQLVQVLAFRALRAAAARARIPGGSPQ
jgi:aerobic carbon-monoxide dehydrogenase medium subunit